VVSPRSRLRYSTRRFSIERVVSTDDSDQMIIRRPQFNHPCRHWSDAGHWLRDQQLGWIRACVRARTG
jgi:hypothetical protein